MVAGDIVFNTDSIAPLRQRLLKDGWLVDVFMYDWRKPLSDQAPVFAHYLQQGYSASTFRVIAHSMGGLLTRMAFSLLGSDFTTGKWLRTIYLGTPHFGSHSAAQALANPAALVSGSGAGAASISQLLLNLGRTTKQVKFLLELPSTVATWRSLYELLPRETAGWVATDPLGPQLYVLANYASQNPSVYAAGLTDAQTTGAALDALLTQPQPSFRNVVGTGTPTPAVLINKDALGDAKSYLPLDGDGFVTVQRATLPNHPNDLILPGALHSSIPGDSRLLAVISSLLSDDTFPVTTIAPLVPPQGVTIDTQPIHTTIETPLPAQGVQLRGDP
jgi:hypothetical protein